MQLHTLKCEQEVHVSLAVANRRQILQSLVGHSDPVARQRLLKGQHIHLV